MAKLTDATESLIEEFLAKEKPNGFGETSSDLVEKAQNLSDTELSTLLMTLCEYDRDVSCYLNNAAKNKFIKAERSLKKNGFIEPDEIEGQVLITTHGALALAYRLISTAMKTTVSKH